MYYDNGSVNYELDQWELDCSDVLDKDTEYLSFEQEGE